MGVHTLVKRTGHDFNKISASSGGFFFIALLEMRGPQLASGREKMANEVERSEKWFKAKTSWHIKRGSNRLTCSVLKAILQMPNFLCNPRRYKKGLSIFNASHTTVYRPLSFAIGPHDIFLQN